MSRAPARRGQGQPVGAVWVTNEASVTPHGGGGIRSQRLVAALAAVMPVEVIALGGELDGPAYCRVTGAVDVRSYAPAVRSRAATARLALTHRWPLSAVRLFEERAYDDVRTAMATARLLVVEHTFLLPYRPRGVRTVLSLQNVDSDLAASVAAASPPENRWNVAMLRRAERRSSRDPEILVVAVSEVDAAKVGADLVVANGTDVPRRAPGLPETGTVLVVGSLGYAPNAAAVRWWAAEVWPLLTSPVALTVVGRGAGAVRDLAGHPAVQLIGEVDDLGGFLAAAQVAVAPLLSGSGTRLKLLEAMAWGRPVVSTAKGAEGLAVQDGREVLLADTAAEFAAAVDRLRADAALAARLAANGRRFAQDFDWVPLGERFAGVAAAHLVG